MAVTQHTTGHTASEPVGSGEELTHRGCDTSTGRCRVYPGAPLGAAEQAFQADGLACDELREG